MSTTSNFEAPLPAAPGSRRILEIKNALSLLGYDPDFDITVMVGDNGDTLALSVAIPLEEFELPEELREYAVKPDEIERAIWKGNVEKKTYAGALYESAIQGYASHRMSDDPQIIALDEALKENITSLEDSKFDFIAARKIREKVWARITSEPKIAAWIRDLEDNFY